VSDGALALEYLECAWLNPFDSDVARAHSSYHGLHDGELVRLLETVAPTPFARVANEAFRGFVLDDAFSCLGAKSSIRRGLYRLGAYARLDDPEVTEGLARDLYAFAAERRGFESDFTTFVAVFREHERAGEPAFEEALWSQLQRLHDLDAAYHPWDPRVSDDPADPGFSFSVAGTAFFVVGMHPDASRAARRFAWPTLIFNAHEQFEHLRDDGRYAGLQRQIRARELRLDGNLNPNLADFGRHSEARQYSGRATDETWRCPFRARS
jgi:FPC/CPF motif-containing protein YcgG